MFREPEGTKVFETDHLSATPTNYNVTSAILPSLFYMTSTVRRLA